MAHSKSEAPKRPAATGTVIWAHEGQEVASRKLEKKKISEQKLHHVKKDNKPGSVRRGNTKQTVPTTNTVTW
jgi:hypothetical protein